MEINVLVGRNVRRIRLEKGLTQERLAEASDLSQQYLSELERGVRNPTLKILAQIAGALGVQPTDLIAPDQGASS
jgi:transcriptional regulator with XRE-family HTH domain